MEGDPNITTSKLFNLILSIIDKSFMCYHFWGKSSSFIC